MTQDIQNTLRSSQTGLRHIAYLLDIANDKISWCDEAAEALGIDRDKLPATTQGLNLMVNPQDLPVRLNAIHAFRVSEENVDTVSLSYRLRLGNGHSVAVEETLCRMERDGELKMQGHLVFEKAATLHDVVIKDTPYSKLPETGSFLVGESHKGRQLLEDILQETLETENSIQIGSGFFLAVGIDRLSILNDAFGVRQADDVIAKALERLNIRFSGFAHVARINGDVFGLLFKQGSAGDMALTAQKIIRLFRDEPVMTVSGPVRIGISVGGSAYDSRTNISADILAQAESALRRAKEQGRGCFVAYETVNNYSGDAQNLLRSGEEFLKALDENRIKLAYQPIMDSKRGKVSFHECLVRMVDRNGGMVNAAHFVPAVETLGMVRMLDQCAMRLAIEELIKFPDIRLSVNVSKWSFCDKDWLRGVVLALRDRPHAARRLIIEITESVAIHDLRQVDKIIKTLKELGCRIALDDFGAGHTGFSQIQDMDVDFIKIDKAFIRGMKEHKNQVFIKAMQMLAEGADLETVGEGAETSDEADQLTNTGIHYIQGYVYGMPSLERVWLPENHVQRKPALNIKAFGGETESLDKIANA